MSHVHLTPYAKMNVKLATQVLRESSVSRLLRSYYPPETHATSELCHYVNHFLIVSIPVTSLNALRREMNFVLHTG